MNRGPVWISPIVALAVLGLAVAHTLEGLGVTGAFGWRVETVSVEVPPAYRSVDRALERLTFVPERVDVRNPFAFARTAAPPRAASRSAPVARTAAPAAPQLTAIVWDSDPRALVRWNGREWTIREGGLFDEFQVVSISREQVTLRRGDATLVLNRRNPGE